MIGIDTSVLLRILADDHPVQASAAERFIAEHCTDEHPGFISSIVLIELCWVLESAYGYERGQIAAALQRILETRQLLVESTGDVVGAIDEYRQGMADFADRLLGRSNRTAGCTHTVTFDRKAARLPTFELLDSGRSLRP